MYSFTVPAGLASVQVSLENITGNPCLGLPTVPDWLGRPNHRLVIIVKNTGSTRSAPGRLCCTGRVL